MNYTMVGGNEKDAENIIKKFCSDMRLRNEEVAPVVMGVINGFIRTEEETKRLVQFLNDQKQAMYENFWNQHHG
jgi:hypothetical protein